MAKSTKKPDGFEMFCYASEFRSAGCQLFEMFCQITDKKQVLVNKLVPAPEDWQEYQSHVPGFIAQQVLNALSLEIYLKCLRRIRGKSPGRGHDLMQKFAEFSRRDQRELRRRFKGYCGVWDLSLESALIRAKGYFLEVRYGYEMQRPRAPVVDNMAGNIGIKWAMESVRDVILAKHPDWEQQYSLLKELD